MPLHSSSHRLGGPSKEKSQYLKNRKSSSPSERRSGSSRDFQTSPRRRSRSPLNIPKEKSFSPSKRKPSPKHATQRQKDSPPHDELSTKSVPQGGSSSTSKSHRRSRHRSQTPDERSQGKGEKPIYRGPDGGATKFDIKELKKVTVNIIRTIPQKEKPPIQRSIINPEEITPVRRADEGTQPIFDRPELIAGGREDSQELKRRLGTQSSLENEPRLKLERCDTAHSSRHYDHKSRDRSPYERKRPRSRSPVELRHRQSGKNEEHHVDEKRRADKYYSRERMDDRGGRLEIHSKTKTDDRHHTSRPHEKERLRTEGERSYHRRSSPYHNRRDHSSERDRHRRDHSNERDRHRRDGRSRENETLRREGSRERHRDEPRGDYEHFEEYPESQEISLQGGMRGGVFRPRLPPPLPHMVWPQPMMPFRPFRPFLLRPGFRPPLRPPPGRFYPPY